MRAADRRWTYTHHTNQRAAARAHPRASDRFSCQSCAAAHSHEQHARRPEIDRSSLTPPLPTRCPPPPAHGPADSGRGNWRRRPDLRGAGGGGRECDPASKSRTLLARSAHEAGKRSSPPDRSGRGADRARRGELVRHDDWQLRPAAGRRVGGGDELLTRVDASGGERTRRGTQRKRAVDAEGGARGEGGEARERSHAIAYGVAVRGRRGDSSAGAERRGEWTRGGGGTARGRRSVERPSSGRELHSQTAGLLFNAHFLRRFFT